MSNAFDNVDTGERKFSCYGCGCLHAVTEDVYQFICIHCGHLNVVVGRASLVPDKEAVGGNG